MKQLTASSEFYTVLELSQTFNIPRSTVTKRARALGIERSIAMWLFTKSQADAIRFFDTKPGPKIKSESENSG
jgi:hypothetical protein